MSDNIDVKARLLAEDDASPVVLNLLRNLRRLDTLAAKMGSANIAARLTGTGTARGSNSTSSQAADFRRQILFNGRISKQREAEQRRNDRAMRLDTAARVKAARQSIAAAARADQIQFRQLRERLAFGVRMQRQRAAEARDIERQDARREAAHRREMTRLDRENRARRRAYAATGRSASSTLRDASSGVGVGVAAGAAGAGLAGRSILRREADVDAAERNSMIYGGLSRLDARQLRDTWAGPVGVQLGASAAEMLNGFTDALKAGVPTGNAKEFSAFSIKLAELWNLAPQQVNEILGGVKAVQTSGGAPFRMSGITSWANTLQLLAGQLSTTPEMLLEYNRQAAGGAALLGMSQEASLAFGAASTTLGNRAGESGSALDYIASRIAGMPQLAKQQGIEGDRARKLLRTLGYGNAAGMERARQGDPDGFVFDLLERLHKVKDPRRRNEALLALSGTEWIGELGRLVTGISTVREARKIQQSAKGMDAIGAAWAIHGEKLAFVGRQVVAGMLGIVGELGKVLGPLAIETGRYFTDWASKNSKAIGINFWAAMQGLVEGFLGREGTFQDLLKATFGGSGITASPAAFHQFAKGFAEGMGRIWSVVKAIGKGLGSALGIDTSTSEGMGELVGHLVGASLAARVLGPALGIVASGLWAIAGAAALFRGLSGAGAAAGAAGALGAGALAVPIMIAGAAVALGVTIANWAELREIWKGWFGEPGWTERRRENDAARARGDNPDPIDGFLERWLGGAFGRRSSTITGGGGQGEAKGYGGADRITGADLAPALAPSTGGGNRAMLDAIARAEGTAGRGDYNASLGYGRFLPGGREQNLTDKTLAEVYQLGLHMRRQPGNPNSSALGRYQITGSTMRDAAAGLGMSMDTTRFDATTQDAMAAWIAKRQGFGAWEGFRRNPAELATAKAAAAGAPVIGGSAIGSALNASNVRYANQGATRNKRITDSLHASLSEAVMNAYGPGYAAEIYSGGQDAKGHGHRRTGSTRHDDGRAADVYIVGPDGKRLRGDMLGPIAQEWLARKRGGVGLEMKGGGVHLDEHRNRAPTWTYGAITPGQRAAVAAGLAGRAPPTPAGIAANVPVPKASPVSFGGGGAGGAGGGGARSGPQISAPITIVAGTQSPREIAMAVQRHMREQAAFRTHDVEYDV